MPDLQVWLAHRPECTFGAGFVRLEFSVGGMPQTRYCQDQAEADRAVQLLRHVVDDLHVVRDGYCLDGMRTGDANTPDVVDAAQWLGMDQREGMRVLGITHEADYIRAYSQIEAAVYRRDNRAAQDGIRAPIVIKRRGAPVVDA